MQSQQQLVERVRALAAKTQRSESTLSRLLFGNGNRLDEIAAGGSITMTTYERAIAKLKEMEKAA